MIREKHTMNKSVRMLTNSSILLSYTIFEIIALFLFNVLSARFLGVEGFGRLIYVISYVLLFSSLADIGTSLGITKCVARNPSSKSDYINAGFTLRLIMSVIFVITTNSSFLIFGKGEDIFLILVLSLAEASRGIAIYIAYIFRGVERMVYEPLFFGMDRFIMLVFGFLVLNAGYGIDELIIIISIARISSLILAIFFYSQNFGRVRLSSSKAFLNDLWKESYPVAMAMISDKLLMYLPPVLLTTFWESTATGLFQSSYKIALFPILVCTVLIQSIYPLIVSSFAVSDKDSVTNLYHFATKMLLNIVLPCFVIFLAFSEDILSFIYGKNYLEAAWALKAMTPYILLTAMLSMSMHFLLAIDRQRVVAKIAICTTIVSIMINFFLISILGLKGAVLALSFVSGISSAVYVLSVQRLGYQAFKLKDNFSQIISSFAMFSIVYYLGNILKRQGLLFIAWTSLLGVATYIFVLMFTGGISQREKAMVKELFNKIAIIKRT